MPASPKAACFADLKRRILTTELEPGSDLDEVTLTEAYGISRTPLREVLQRLAGDGYVTLTANRGAQVGVIDLAAIRALVASAPLIHASVARLAATLRPSSEIAALAEAERQFERSLSLGDARAVALADHRFHAMLGHMARNPYLAASLNRLLIDQTRAAPDIGGAATPNQRRDADLAVTHHRMVLHAIRDGDPEAAASAAVSHWALTRQRLEVALRPQELPIDVL